MRKCPLCLLILLMSANLASADTVTLTVPLTSGQTKAAGFREIPPGRHTYIVTLTASTIYGSSWGGGGYATWLPTSTPSGGSSHVYTTSTIYDQYEIGTPSGWAYLSTSMMPPYYGIATCLTTNATWFDTMSTMMSSGMPPNLGYTQLRGYGMPWTDLVLPSSFPADYLTGQPLPSFSVASYSSGYVWFTSDDANVAVYRLDSGTNTWLKADTPFLYNSGSGPALATQQFELHAAKAFATTAKIKIRHRHIDSVNPGADGDTIDTIELAQPPEANY